MLSTSVEPTIAEVFVDIKTWLLFVESRTVLVVLVTYTGDSLFSRSTKSALIVWVSVCKLSIVDSKVVFWRVIKKSW